jgi:beta-glucosidase
MEELLALMTLEEKVGQMTQAERQDINKFDIENYFLGSVLSGGGSVPADNSVKGWSDMTDGMAREASRTRLGIPIIYGVDAVHGHNNVAGATVFPHNVALGAIAAGDLANGTRLAEAVGAATAEEMLATGVPWTFSPVLGVPYDIRWGRTYECFGENADLAAAMGAAVIRGLQGGGSVAACMKHYLGEGQTKDGRNQGDATMTDEDIREILPPYIEAINAGALTLMPSFSSVNGVKMHENKALLTDLLKGELGFEGFIVSDWAALTQLSGGSYKNQIANAINAGVDMVMATNGRWNWVEYIKLLKELAGEGTVPMERIDDAVLRILRVKEKLGLFEGVIKTPAETVGSEKHRALAREAATASATLLKNKNDVIGRLSGFEKILVAGEGASDLGMQCGGWTITWQGSHGAITQGTTLLEGIRQYKPDAVFSPDGTADGPCDCAIVVIGEDPYAEGDGDRPYGVELRGQDVAVLNEVYKLDCPVIVILLSGRPMLVAPEIGRWDALVAAWLPGSEGDGVADALFSGFTGKTPFTWPVAMYSGEALFPCGWSS